MNCPTCGNDKVKKSGVLHWLDSKARSYVCLKCGRGWKDIGRNPRLLYFDIETTQTLFKGWRPGQQYVSSEQIVQDWRVLSWAAKWICTSNMMSMVLSPNDMKNQDDKRIVRGLWDLFDQADVIIGHNSDRFDIKKMNWRFIYHDMKPPKPYRTVDTLKAFRSVAGASGNSMDFLARELDLNGGKKRMHREDWDECEGGNPAALRKMREYNEHDVIVGESLYLKIRPWMRNHPNMGLYYETDREMCKNCGSTQLDKDEIKTVKTAVNNYVCWICRNCGANGRTPEAVIDKDKRKSLMR